MITVVKHGNFKVYERTCTNCRCVFRFTQDDIKTITAFVIPIQAIQCPDCKDICEIKERIDK